MLAINNVTKNYAKVCAARNVSFKLENGTIGVILGPNGAGKSTTIKCIAGLLRHEGDISISGYPNKSMEARKILGYVPETPALYDLLTVGEHFDFIAKAYNIDEYKDKKQELLERYELADKTDKLGKELSKGMQQKVSICCNLLISPKVIIFDEPMVGLDPKAIKTLKEEVINLKKQGCTILISTHIIDSVDEIWDKAIIMNKGTVVKIFTKEQMEQQEYSLEEIFLKLTEA